MKTTTILCLFLFTLSSTVFVSCDKKRKRGSSGRSETSTTVEIDTPDQLSDEFLAVMSRMGDVFLTITDKETAEEAVVKIEGFADEWEALAIRFEQLEDPSEEERVRLEAKFKEAQKRFEAKMKNANPQAFKDPEILGLLGPAMKKMEERLDKYDPVLKKFGFDG